MSKPHLRAGVLSALVMGGVLSAASPAWAHHTGFEKSEYRVREDAAYVELVVGSAPCCPGPTGQVDYLTSNLSAIAGEDFQQTSGTLTFPACYSSGCTIRVPIMGDEVFEGEEQFEVKLTNWRGIFEPSGTTAVVRILDDDPKPTSNSAASDRSSQQTAGASSGASSARKPSPQPSGTSGAAKHSDEATHSIPEDKLFEEGAVGADETDASENSDHPRSAAPAGPESPIVPLIALGSLLGLTGAVLWVVFRRRKSTLNRAKVG